MQGPARRRAGTSLRFRHGRAAEYTRQFRSKLDRGRSSFGQFGPGFDQSLDAIYAKRWPNRLGACSIGLCLNIDRSSPKWARCDLDKSLTDFVQNRANSLEVGPRSNKFGLSVVTEEAPERPNIADEDKQAIGSLLESCLSTRHRRKPGRAWRYPQRPTIAALVKEHILKPCCSHGRLWPVWSCGISHDLSTLD